MHEATWLGISRVLLGVIILRRFERMPPRLPPNEDLEAIEPHGYIQTEYIEARTLRRSGRCTAALRGSGFYDELDDKVTKRPRRRKRSNLYIGINIHLPNHDVGFISDAGVHQL